MFERFRQFFSTKERDAELAERLEEIRKKTPVPVIWLFGKTQSGKTSIVKFLTRADDAEIGNGFKPCTQFSREYAFPTLEAPLMSFLDTRGVGEPDYDPAEDIAKFHEQANVVMVTVKVLDHATAKLVEDVRRLRESKPDRPMILVLTCLHEAYPQQQHWQPYPFGKHGEVLSEHEGSTIPNALLRSVQEQMIRFDGLFEYVVPVDLTPAAEGFDEPEYGGARLKEVLLETLPAAYRQTMLTLDDAMGDLQDLYARHALPHITGFASMAASAGAIPIPLVDMVLIPAIQTRMIYHLAKFYGQPLTGQRFIELAGTLGMGMLVRQAARGVTKFIPFVGSVAGAAFAWAATFALGKAFCYYYSAVHKGHTPKPEELRNYYREQLSQAENLWKKQKADPK